MADKQKRVFHLSGLPNAGKTWMGDYLESRGYFHIDGDGAGQSKDPKMMELWGGLMKTFMLKPDEPKPENLWMPFFTHLADQVREAVKKHDRVVITFASCGAFGEGEIKLFTDAYADIKFVKIDVDLKELTERHWARTEIFLKA